MIQWLSKTLLGKKLKKAQQQQQKQNIGGTGLHIAPQTGHGPSEHDRFAHIICAVLSFF
jgi:hypothetical protein